MNGSNFKNVASVRRLIIRESIIEKWKIAEGKAEGLIIVAAGKKKRGEVVAFLFYSRASE